MSTKWKLNKGIFRQVFQTTESQAPLLESTANLSYYICQERRRKQLQFPTLQREVSTSSTWDWGCIEPLIHIQHGAIVTVVESFIKSHIQ